ncbi:flavin reductase family protein [Paraburkholderia bonniea]|uniref:flavin reductase family protein n=1 Tax=Paraburkholderia bonniea TaxID=2152891 RepID=UPI0012926AE6|nr:flavin reductase family protein [Paraburkholderia bonniea]WJF90867.1 flavin reductase family protein [Paraburkholderia bonniea]WJF94181.1 flavin reductase family protein [Paraburkholderia bonniea]
MILDSQQEAFRQAMRRLAATVTVVATGSAPQRSGLTATAVCSLTVDPPQVLACLNASSATCAAIREAGTFSVNLLPSHRQGLAECFAGVGNLHGDQRFARGDWTDETPGSPILHDAVAAMACELRSAWQVDTHFIMIGAVQKLWLASEALPLVYRNGQFGTWSPV